MATPSVAPDDSSTLSTLKRKRSTSPNAPPGSNATEQTAQVYLDILDALRSLDNLRTVLDHAITPVTESKDTDAPSNKRVKLTGVDSIATRLQSGYYTDRNFDDVLKDIRDVTEAVVEPIKTTLARLDRTQPPSDDLLTVRRVQTFATKASNLLRRNLLAKSKDKDTLKEEPESTSANMTSSAPAARTVLTLFGNAPTPKQLFSSLQHPTDSTDPHVEPVDLDLEPLGLPNMLNATKVLPLTPDAALGGRPKQPTFAQVFPPPATLPPLHPPKPKSTARSASISWVTKDTALPKPSRKNTYTMQPLIVGSWLDYGARDADRESSGAIKRRRRESIVSAAPAPKPIEDMSPEEILAQEQALFKTAYSSFAPPTDNSKAIVSNEIRDRVWWHKIGHERFDKRFVLDPALEDSFPTPISTEDAMTDEPATFGSNDEMKAFEEVIANFDEDAFNADLDKEVIDINDQQRTTEQMLQDISALIETLSSYQRIRNSTIASATSSRNPTSPSPALAALIGTPTEPTKDETTVYKALRSQLAQLISKLPPYAVAKLDGEQLEDLIVSKTITVAGKEYKGTMEEDTLTRMIKSSAAVQAAAGPSSTARPADYKSSSSYSRSNSLAQPPRSAQAPNPGYYSGARTPAPAFNRSTIAPQNYGTPATAGGSQRQSYSAASGYPATAPRPTASYGGQANGQQQPGYRSGYNYGSAFNTTAPGTPAQQGDQTSGVQQQPQSQYRPTTQQPQGSAAGYPPRPAAYGTPGPQYSTQRPNGQPPTQAAQHSTSDRATPVQGQNQMQTPGPTGFHTSMTSEQQAMLMERQRAQMASQGAARASAVPGVSAAPAPGTPGGIAAPVTSAAGAAAAAAAVASSVAGLPPQAQGQPIVAQGRHSNGLQGAQLNGQLNGQPNGLQGDQQSGQVNGQGQLNGQQAQQNGQQNGQ